MKILFYLSFVMFALFMSCKKTKTPEAMFDTFYGYVYKVSEDNKVKELSLKAIVSTDSLKIYEEENLILNSSYKVISQNDNNIFIKANNNTFSFNVKENKLCIIDLYDENITLLKYNDFLKNKVNEYAIVDLKCDISWLSENEKEMLKILFDVANIMDELYWLQVCPYKDSLLATIENENLKKLFLINYGPYEKLRNNKPFIDNVPPYNEKQTFYPIDITKEEFEKWNNPEKYSWYTIIRRDSSGNLISIPYSEFYKEKLTKAAELLYKASQFSENQSFKKYLQERAKSFVTNNYFTSDMAWMDVTNNNIDFIAGPIESYDDEFMGLKTSFESFILIKDKEWTNRLNFILKLLPELQANLPVEKEYKNEKPGEKNDIGVYDAIYYAGDCNAGSKTIAINLPNDKKVNELKGSRKLQLKNAIQAKFDKILRPISQISLANEHNKNVSFNAFFENIMFHEIAHGLGISKTVKDKKLVSEALKETHTIIEEAKADMLGLYLLTYLYENKKMTNLNLENNYITFVAGIFRSIRFGLGSSHGKANMIEFNYLFKHNAISFNKNKSKFTVNIPIMKQAIKEFVSLMLTIQGNGDYEKAKSLISEYANLTPEIKTILIKINEANIPKDIIFNQGKHLFPELIN
ncbi:MAG: Zn-dependent hydrolase [Bacteroidales bacterium]|nr:Zn-dependent hydrolase [Bacteroidales bacterium]